MGMRRYGIGPGAATLAFNTLTLNELAHAVSARSDYRHVFGGQKLPPNKALQAANLGMLALQALVSFTPFGRTLLGTTPLALYDLGVIAAGVMIPLVINEGTKPAAPKLIEADHELEAHPENIAVLEENTQQEKAA